MRRTSRAFAPRPLYTPDISNKDEKKVISRNELQKEKLGSQSQSQSQHEAQNDEMKLRLKMTKLRLQEEPTTHSKQKSITTTRGSQDDDGDIDDDDDTNEESDLDYNKLNLIRRRSSSFSILKNNEPIESQSSREPIMSSSIKHQEIEHEIPVKKLLPKNRYQSKPLFQTTPTNITNFVNKSTNNVDNYIEKSRQNSSSQMRKYYNNSDQLLKNKRNDIIETTEDDVIEIDTETTSSDDQFLDNIQRSIITPVTDKEIEASPLYPVFVREVQTVALVRKLKRVIFDFRSAQEERAEEQARLQKLEKTKEKRSQILQRMLKLDMVETRIFVMQAYDYDKYMSAASASKSIQASTQTNDDTEEQGIQTDPMREGRVRWTQMPPRWSDTKNALVLEQSIRNKNFGVGEDTRFPNKLNSNNNNKIIDNRDLNQIDFIKEQEKLINFVRGASHLIMAILESKKQMQLPINTIVSLDRKLIVLRDLEIRTICCDHEFIACTNGQCDFEKYVGGKNMVTVWSLQEPSLPMYFLRVWGQVIVLEINKICSIVITGNKDGSLNIWDLKESAQYHSRNREDQVIRTPSVTTGGLIQVLQNHKTSIIGVQILPESQRRSRIFSLDRNKILVFWSCSHEDSVDIRPEIGYVASHWSTLRIQIRQVINLYEIFLPTTIDFKFLKIWDHNSFHFLIGTDYGYIGKGIIADLETKVLYEKIYAEDSSNIIMLIYSVDLNLDKNLILGAYEDENCRLFDMSLKKVILILHCGGKPSKVRWSRRRRSLFYVLLSDRIDIWDLLSSDLTPTKSMNFNQPKDFDILNTRNNEFVVVIRGDGITIETPPLEVNPLTAREESRFKLYLAIIQ